LYQQLPVGFADLRLGNDFDLADEKSRPGTGQSHIMGSQLQSRDLPVGPSGLIAANVLQLSALSLGDQSMGEFLIATDDDEQLHGINLEKAFGPYEARDQYQKKVAQMDIRESIASTVVDWL
jgi:hypothetical protein